MREKFGPAVEFLQKFASYIGGSWVRISPQDKKINANTSHVCSFRNGVCFYRRIRRIAGMRTEAPSPDVRIADRPCGLHRRFGYRRFLVSPVRPIAGFVLEALSPEFPSPEPHIAGRSIAGRFLMCYRRVSKSGDEIRRYQATSPAPCLWQAPASTQKTKRKTRPGPFAGACGGTCGGGSPSAPETWPTIMDRAVEGECSRLSGDLHGRNRGFSSVSLI